MADSVSSAQDSDDVIDVVFINKGLDCDASTEVSSTCFVEELGLDGINSDISVF